jgi:hypothetical protein
MAGGIGVARAMSAAPLREGNAVPSGIRRASLFILAAALLLGSAAPSHAQIWFPYPYPAYGYAVDSSLRIEVTPKDAEVYVDGYYAGIVDDFDGTFQRLHIAPGPHEVTVYRDGYRSLRQTVYAAPNSTLKIKGDLERLGAADAPQPRPTPAPPPQAGPPNGTPPGPLPARGRVGRRGPPPPSPPPAETPPGADGQPSSRTGTLSLRVEPPDAEVLIDGAPWRGVSAERVVVDLSDGQHNIQVRKQGFVGYLTDVQIRRGETTTLDVNLRPQP